MLMNWTIRVAFCTRFALIVVGGHLDSGDSNDILHEFSRRFEDLERKVAEQSALIARQTEQLREQSEAMTNLKNIVEVQDDTITELKHLVEMQQQQQQQQHIAEATRIASTVA
ncbi:uncharacterized protein LOC123533014 [Mercenaria mercenaria]|uniref:uncharacterized protein LOC123533014 n=1 Tax=Mercenaria mercenaria TaxID=6596 RepID=UPI00234E66C1|nr:uncharacterized protein LOC123533014 [Mercenaria mercenaria]